MIWNWQQPDWPNFQWDAALLRQAEAQFLLASGKFSGVIQHFSDGERKQIIVESLSAEALTTSEIEGEVLDRASVQSSIRQQLGLGKQPGRSKPAEQGIAETIVSVYNSFSEPLSQEILFDWHKLVLSGQTDITDIGRYRKGSDAMQVVSGALYRPRVHFEAPPAKTVPAQMTRFIKWFNRTAPDGREPLPALTRAGIAHLYFESIHPFEDGNGRIGRAISEKALAQSAGRPTLTALAATILQHRKAYYQELEAANKSNEITRWLKWFAEITLESQNRTEAQIEFLLDKTRLLDRLSGQLNERQQKALLRMLREGPEGFEGGLSAGKYASITKASPATTTRDLADLVDKKALARTGELRHARYTLTIQPRPVHRVRIGTDGMIR